MITRIEAIRYRCFRKLDLELGTYHVFAGANGSGKSTLLDIPLLLGDLLLTRSVGGAFLDRLDGRIAPRAQTVDELVFNHDGSFFAIKIEARIPPEITDRLFDHLPDLSQRDSDRRPTSLRYAIHFEIFNDELQIAGEHLILFPDNEKFRVDHGGDFAAEEELPDREHWWRVIQRSGGKPAIISPEFRFETDNKGKKTKEKRTFNFRLRPDQLTLTSVPADQDLFPTTLWFKDLLLDGAVSYEPDWEKMRIAAPPGLGNRLRADGQNLPWLLQTLRETNKETYRDWVAHVKTALPNVKSIDVRVRQGDRHAYFEVTYQSGLKVASSSLSEGTLRILSLSALPYLLSPPALVAIEQPEDGIHPQAVEAVLEAFKMHYDGQVWLSTHSPVVLAHTELSQILAMRLKNGSVEVVRGNEHPRLQEWQGGLNPGELFAAGILS